MHPELADLPLTSGLPPRDSPAPGRGRGADAEYGGFCGERGAGLGRLPVRHFCSQINPAEVGERGVRTGVPYRLPVTPRRGRAFI